MFTIVVGSGANLFILIVAILMGVAAGLTTTNYLKTKAKEKKWENSAEPNQEAPQ